MIGFVIMVIGGILAVLGSIGMIRFPDVYSRSQSQTVVIVGGTCIILFGAFLDLMVSLTAVKMIFLIIIIFVTSPVGTHSITKAAYKSGVKPAVSRDEWGDGKASPSSSSGQSSSPSSG